MLTIALSVIGAYILSVLIRVEIKERKLRNQNKKIQIPG